MKVTKVNRSIFIAIMIIPSINYEVCNYFTLNNQYSIILCFFATICLISMFVVVLMQLIASFDWLYSKEKSLISLKPLYLIYNDPNNSSENPSYKERVVHTLLGFFLYLLMFTNFYQYLSWQNIKNFNHDQYLNFIDLFYFTTVTSATVGFGDIFPKTSFARLIVTIQILTTFLYVIGILASLPSILSKLEDKHD
jgi:CBS domain containing-hemolysin-like protein